MMPSPNPAMPYLNPDKFERFVRWFLRFNGYFGVENFIVHAGDDPSRISDGIVAPYTETDILAVRMPHSCEIAGPVTMATYGPLVGGSEDQTDVVIAEAKTGEAKPNRVWREGDTETIKYMARFIGLWKSEAELQEVASHLASRYRWEAPGVRVRYIVFCVEPNQHYASRGVTYLNLYHMLRFFVRERGECWLRANLGVASAHYQWDPVINRILEIANDAILPLEEKCRSCIRELRAP